MATVETVGEFLEYIQANHASADDFWYRGHASVGWGLSPSVFRTPGRQENERLLLKRFMQEARRHSSDVPSEEWDWTFLAQHHFVPTRLLDWSESPLVGLYFAALDTFDIADDPKTARDGRIWILQPNKLNSQVGHPFVGRDLPMFGVDGMLDSYRPFVPPTDRLQPVAALAARSFPRIAAQWGTFTVSTDGTSIEDLDGSTTFLTSLTVPMTAKSGIRTQLAAIGVDERTLYMDLFRLGLHVTKVFA